MTRRSDPKALPNDQLLQQVQSLVSRTNRDLAELLWHLAEVDARGLYRDEACSSMFTYCRDRLGFSEPVAFKRITAARLVRKFPAILRRVACGDLHLTALKTLAKVLTAENHGRVLAAAAGKKTHEVEMLVASLAPKPDVPPRIRKLPDRDGTSVGRDGGRGGGGSGPPQLAMEDERTPGTPHSPSPVAAAPAPRPDRGTVAPLREDRFRVQFTASAELRDKLRRAEELLGPVRAGAGAGGDIALVVERALDQLIEVLEKRRFAKTSRPQKKKRPRKPGTRYVPRQVRREVAERDGGRCTFVDKAGRRCEERRALELHHKHAFALGGAATTGNMALICRSHNALEAERDFGSEHMERARRSKEAAPRRTPEASGEARPRERQLTDARPPPTSCVRDGGLLGTGFAATTAWS